ncbi:hypothetical protein CY658_21710 [Variovorax sp. RO1]|uniref:hypothetical protein n=1 Tax=Variovorax sp. RO1 TaxID=2066034 RepID=UPI000C716E2D|nr:hypothetical protein [Variovorax sp. RO1]PLC03435.1 hypothetical protein CY658_21710 [Variovorax sp. RO1]
MTDIHGISRKEWKFVANASRADFELLVAAEEWKVLDNLAEKVRYYGTQFEPEAGHQDFLDLYDYTSEYLTQHGELPPAVQKLVRGE